MRKSLPPTPDAKDHPRCFARYAACAEWLTDSFSLFDEMSSTSRFLPMEILSVCFNAHHASRSFTETTKAADVVGRAQPAAQEPKHEPKELPRESEALLQETMADMQKSGAKRIRMRRATKNAASVVPDRTTDTHVSPQDNK
jgi:hypothetical protein